MEEEVGFEPTVRSSRTTVFKTAVLSDISYFICSKYFVNILFYCKIVLRNGDENL